MNDYFQYVHNLKGVARYERFKPATRDAIVSLLLRPLESFTALESKILENSNPDALHFIAQHLDLKRYQNSIVLTARNSSYVDEVDFDKVHAIINLNRVNNTQHPNKLFRAVNTLLPNSGFYIGTVETYNDRKMSFFRRHGKFLGQLKWYADFFINRVIPRIRFVENFYYMLTDGQFHSISETEILGRLVYCGFEVIDTKAIGGLTYFVSIKVKKPMETKNPSYYPLVKLPRVGKDGKVIRVYKFRTMHPYSEFIQDYIVRMNGYNDKGKPANDYRVTRWGGFMRKWWIDELPQLIHVIKGEMKLVGLRPLSCLRFNEFPEDLQKERVKYKPGCIPPYVALNMPTDLGEIEAERIYIADMQKHPYTTDIRYFMKAVFNIVTNKIRSA
ncbi:MAG: sugar transferase [Bacteroidales bacterium]|nr:sugar transferase [Bacteroidales bacterium]